MNAGPLITTPLAPDAGIMIHFASGTMSPRSCWKLLVMMTMALSAGTAVAEQSLRRLPPTVNAVVDPSPTIGVISSKVHIDPMVQKSSDTSGGSQRVSPLNFLRRRFSGDAASKGALPKQPKAPAATTATASNRMRSRANSSVAPGVTPTPALGSAVQSKPVEAESTRRSWRPSLGGLSKAGASTRDRFAWLIPGVDKSSKTSPPEQTSEPLDLRDDAVKHQVRKDALYKFQEQLSNPLAAASHSDSKEERSSAKAGPLLQQPNASELTIRPVAPKPPARRQPTPQPQTAQPRRQQPVVASGPVREPGALAFGPKEASHAEVDPIKIYRFAKRFAPLPDALPAERDRIDATLEIANSFEPTPAKTPAQAAAKPVADRAPRVAQTLPAPATETSPGPSPVVTPAPSLQPPVAAPAPVVAAPAPPAPQITPTPAISPTPSTEGVTSRRLLLKAARNAVAQGRLREAIVRFEGLLESYPNDVEALREYAGLLAQAGEFAKSEAQYRRLVSIAPDYAEGHQSFAGVLMQQQKFDLAARQLEAAIRLHPEDQSLAIDLVRCYGFAGNTAMAMKLYNERLASLDPNNPGVQQTMAPLLMEIQRPDLALDMLLRWRGRTPEDITVAAMVARAYSQMGYLDSVREVVDSIAGVSPESVDARLDLADELADSEQPMSALALYEQTLQAAPENYRAHLGTARVLLRIYEPRLAGDLLAKFSWAESSLEVQLLRADFYRTIGAYADAAAICKELVLAHPQDDRPYVLLGDVYRSAQLYQRAKTAYNRALYLNPGDRATKIKLARNFRESARFGASSQICLQMLDEDPEDLEAFRLLIENLLSTGCCKEADNRTVTRLAEGSPYSRGRVELHLIRGRALLECGRPHEALRMYKAALSLPGGKIPETYYGLYACHHQLGETGTGMHVLAPVLAAYGPNAYARIRVAEMAIADCDYALANELLKQMFRYCTYDNTIAQILVGEANSACVTCCNAGTAREAFGSVLASHPENIRARMGLARVNAALGCCCEAITNFDAALRYMPDNTVAATERARSVEMCEGYCEADAAYAAARKTTQQHDPRYPIEALQSAPEYLPPYEGEYYASASEDAIVRTENLAKYNKIWRAYGSISQFNKLIGMQPWNQDAYFELGQQYATTKQTCREIAAYESLLCLNPCHCDAANALHHARMRLAPKVIGEFDYFGQEGRNGVAEIDRFRWGLIGEYVTGDENEYWRAGYRVRSVEGDFAPAITGHSAYFRGQQKFDSRSLWFAELEAIAWSDLVSNRPEFDVGVQYTTSENLDLRFAVQLQNVLENGGSLAQDIYRVGYRAEFEGMPTRRWRMFGRYRYWDYNDDNTAHEFSLHNTIQLTNVPRKLDLLLNADFWGYAEETIFGPAPDEVLTAIHPYFAPDGYLQVGAHLDYTIWHSQRTYTGADQAYCAVRYGVKFDSESEFFQDVELRAHEDFSSRCSAGVRTFYENSSVYEAVGVGVYLIGRFP